MPYLSRLNLTIFTSLLSGLFFILVLHFKISYSLIPLLLALIGLILAVKNRAQNIKPDWADKLLAGTFISYFLLFVLSMLIHSGRASELDIPSRLVLLLPLIALFYRVKLKAIWLLYAIVTATLIAGIVGLWQSSILQLRSLFPAHMSIQAGDILMSLSLFSLAIGLYFRQLHNQRGFWLSMGATLFGFLACLLSHTRGAWIALPITIPLILVLYRHLRSKRVMFIVLALPVLATLLGYSALEKRIALAKQEMSQYVEYNDGNSSVGARLDMWKSALIGIQEKPVLGWGLQGVKTMREQHHQQGLISEFASSFDHAHNQYLHDGSARGLVGLSALLAIFLAPLWLFWRNLTNKQTNALAYLWGSLGIIHIIATMIYCLTQAFLSHNSGIMFYGFVTLLFYALQKASLNSPLEGGS